MFREKKTHLYLQAQLLDQDTLKLTKLTKLNKPTYNCSPSQNLTNQTYLQETPDDPDSEQSVRTVLPCLISRISAPVTPTVVPLFTADAPVKATVPKFANATCDPPESKSSTIHSALYSQSEPKLASLLNVCVTLLPVVLLVILAVPPVLLLAVTVTVMEFPAARLMPLKSCA